MNFYTDPWFYAVAIPAVILLGISKSGFGSAFGSIAVPLIALTVTVPQAVALLLPALLVMDVLGIRAFWRDADRALLKRLLPAGLAGILLGYLTFKLIPVAALQLVLGLITVAFTLLRIWQGLQKNVVRAPYQAPPLIAWICGIASGLTSFVAHAGGPPLSLYLMPLRLKPVIYVATVTVFFATVNVAKWVPYFALGLWDKSTLGTALLLTLFAPIGNFIGVRIARTIDAQKFYRIVNAALLLTGSKLIFDGWRGLIA